MAKMDTNKQETLLTTYTMTLIGYKARQLVGKAGYTQDDIPDIEQDLIKSLLACQSQYDPARATVATFCARVVGCGIVDLLRRRNAEIRDHGREACSLNEMIETEDGSRERIETVSQDEIDLRSGRYARPAEERAHLQIDMDSVLDGLTPELRLVAEMLQTKSVSQVARELGIPRRTFREKHLTQLREVFSDKPQQQPTTNITRSHDE